MQYVVWPVCILLLYRYTLHAYTFMGYLSVVFKCENDFGISFRVPVVLVSIQSKKYTCSTPITAHLGFFSINYYGSIMSFNFVINVKRCNIQK